MDREDLDRLGVGLEPAAALLVARVLLGLGDPPPQPRGERGRPELLGRRGGVQQLADVAQVGQPPLAVGAARARAPAAPRRASPSRPATRRRAPAARAPRCAAGGGRPPTPRRPRTRPAPRVQPRNGVSAAARARGVEVGRSIASSSRSQSRAGGVPNTLPAPLITAGIPAASSSSRTSAALRCVRTSTATWPGATALAAPARCRRRRGARSRRRRRAARRGRRRGPWRCARAPTRCARSRPASARSTARRGARRGRAAARRPARPTAAARGSAPRRGPRR